MLDFLLPYRQFLIVLAWGSLVLFIVSLAVIPWLVTKIPVDYFQPQYRTRASSERKKSVVTRVFVSVKNLLGLALVCLGIIMLMTPGQGLLTILVGLVLTDFPGKHKIEQKLIAMPKVLSSLNWIRAKAKKPPLVL